MKTEISRDSHQPEKRYSGVYQQQGRMLTDADWNELVDILKGRLNEALKDVVGSGSPLHRNVVNNESDPPKLQWGHVYVAGIDAAVRPDQSAAAAPDFDYGHQEDFPAAPDVPGAADYVFYADVWERTVTPLMDERLRDKGLHGADTATRKQTLVQVKWCPYDAADPALPDNDPETSPKNPAKGDARLSATLLRKNIEPDQCDPCAAQLDVESVVGNYLFRVEVHDVQGPADAPGAITLKWSSENGAEQFEALAAKADMPAGFISDKRVYEFFDETSERHLGVHRDNNEVSPWEPVRVALREIKEPSDPYAVPAMPGSAETRTYVRRWDGYCTLDLAAGTLTGVDRGVSLSTAKAENSLGYVKIDDRLQIVLDSIQLDLELTGKKFVAGDYWLFDVREDEHDPLDPAKTNDLLINEPPHGIEHHYLTLGKVVGGVLETNPAADRKYAFPPLSEMTRLFAAGGDGQEVRPGEALPQPLRVGVANGERPVQGAVVRFQIEAGGGSLSEVNGGATDAEGVAACQWSPGSAAGDDFRVRATLVDPEDPAQDLALPPVYFYANLIAADQVTYTSDCEAAASGTVHHLLAGDSTTPPDPFTLGPDGYYTVKEALDALLCRMKAQHIPYDPTRKPQRWEDINEETAGGPPKPETVQDALDHLVENLESSDIIYRFLDTCDDTDYGVKSLSSYIRQDLGKTAPNSTAKIEELWDRLLCLLDAGRLPYDPTIQEARWRDIKEIGHLGVSWSVEEETPGGPVAGRLVKDGDGNVIAAASSIQIAGSASSGLTTQFFAVIVKLDDGGQVIWKKELNAQVGGLGIQSDGTIVIGGSFFDDLELGGSAPLLSSSGESDIYVAGLDPDGEALWNLQFGASESEIVTDLAIDSADSICLTGYFRETLNFGGSDLTPGADQDMFIARLNADGSHAQSGNYATSGEVKDARLQIDQSDNIIVAGSFAGGLDFGGEPLASSAPSTDSIFLAKLNTSLDRQWSFIFGGAGPSGGSALAIDAEGNLLLGGYYQGVVNFGGADLPDAASQTAFIARFSDNGPDISQQWSKPFGGALQSHAMAIAADADLNIVFGGRFSGAIDFGGGEVNAAEGSDAFVARLSGNGDYIWANRFSAGQQLEFSQSIVLDDDGYPTFAWQMAKDPVMPSDTTLNHITKLDWQLPIAPATVQEALDDLVGNLESSDINYRLPVCAGTIDSVRKRLFSLSGLTDNTAIKIKNLFDVLLCELDASAIPFDRHTNAGSLIDGFVDAAGDTMTGALRVQDNLIVDDNLGVGTGPNPAAKLAVNGGVHVGGESNPGDNNLLVDGDCTIEGNLNVNGTTTTVNTAEMTIEDPVVTLNRYDSTAPNTLDAGIEVYRGSEDKAHLTWNEALDRWEYGTEGNMLPIASGQQALVTGAVSFNSMPVGSEMISNWIDPGLGSGKLCVVLGNWNAADLYIGDENAAFSFRDVVYRAQVDAVSGRLRIFARRVSGSGRRTRKIQWWAMLPGSEESDQIVRIQITITPASASLQTGASIDFNAVVSGTTDPRVTWRVQEGPAGGSVNSNGLYTAPNVAGVFHVVATAAADTAVQDIAEVTVTKPKEKEKDKEKEVKEKEKDKDIVDKIKDTEKTFDVTPIDLAELPRSESAGLATGDPESGVQPDGRAFIRPEERPDLTKPPEKPSE